MNATFTRLALLSAVLLASCAPPPAAEFAELAGPTEEPAASPTPIPVDTAPSIDAPAPTPTPTPTPAPIHALSVIVTGAGGAPVENALVMIPQTGEMAPCLTGAEGQCEWADLPASVTVTVKAQGYLSVSQTLTLAAGQNGLALGLERDPYGLLPSEACAPGETLLYLEDFQDGRAQGWPRIEAAITLGAENGWHIVEDSAEGGNLVLVASGAPGAVEDVLLFGYQFQDAVWRLRLKVTDRDTDAYLNWRYGGDESARWRYVFQVGSERTYTNLMRGEAPGGMLPLVGSQHAIRDGDWYALEISTYGAMTQLWVDGDDQLNYLDPAALGPGTLGLEVHLFEGAQSAYAFDNLVVCGLNAPFTP